MDAETASSVIGLTDALEVSIKFASDASVNMEKDVAGEVFSVASYALTCARTVSSEEIHLLDAF